MPRKLDDPSSLSMADILRLPEDDPRRISEVELARSEHQPDQLATYHDEIKRHYPWYDRSPRSIARLHATLSIKLQKPLDWFLENVTYDQFCGLVEVVANSDGPLVQIQQPLEKDDVKEQLLQRWNAMPDDATWADLATQELHDPAQKDSVRLELQRYAKRTKKFIRPGKAGSRKS